MRSGAENSPSGCEFWRKLLSPGVVQLTGAGAGIDPSSSMLVKWCIRAAVPIQNVEFARLSRKFRVRDKFATSFRDNGEIAQPRIMPSLGAADSYRTSRRAGGRGDDEPPVAGGGDSCRGNRRPQQRQWPLPCRAAQ